MNKIVKIIFVFAVSFFIIEIADAQSSLTWNRIYNGPLNWFDGGYDICQTTDSNFVVVGYTRNPNYLIYAIKLNAFGDTIWSRVISSNSLSNKTAYSVANTPDGGCVLTGESDSIFITKLNISGEVVWTNYYGNSNGEIGYCINYTSDNKILVSGSGGLILKADSTGNLIWKKYYNAERLNYIDTALEDGYIVTGYIKLNSDTSKALLIKIDTSGNLIWQSVFRINNSTSAVALCKIKDSYLLAGRTNLFGNIKENFILKTDANGNELFKKIFKSDISEYFNDLKIINVNKFIICMERDSLIGFPPVFSSKVIIIDSLGDILNEKSFNYGGGHYLNSILLLKNQNYIFTGTSRPVSFGGIDDIWVVRTDSLLSCPPLGIKKINSIIPQKNLLYQNFPNPFNPSTKIIYEVAENSNICIKLYNSIGKLIKTIVDERHYPGIYEIEFNGINFPSGIYFCILSYENLMVETKKMLIVK